MKVAGKVLTALVVLLIHLQDSLAQKSNGLTSPVMAGISNEGQNKNKPYLTAGDRTYIVGTQDGNFPDVGSHVKGEMGGLWMQPIKLLDGFWVKLSDAKENSEAWLKDAREFVNYPYGNRFIYPPVLKGIEVQRLQFCPQGKEGMVVQYQIKNTTNRVRSLQLQFVAKTDLSPVWFSKENNIIDATDSVYWIENKNLFAAQDTRNPWFTIWGSSLSAISHDTQVVAPVETNGLGKSGSATYQLMIKPHAVSTVVFVISGSNKNLETAQTNYESILKITGSY
jgi:hypothetical protein